MLRIFKLVIECEVKQNEKNPFIIPNTFAITKRTSSKAIINENIIIKELEANWELKDAIYSSIINSKSYLDMTPFYRSCLYGKNDIFEYFKLFNPNPNIRNSKGTYCLHEAIKSGNFEIVKGLLSMNTNCSAIDYLGNSPLMLACQKKLVSIALLILEVTFMLLITLENY